MTDKKHEECCHHCSKPLETYDIIEYNGELFHEDCYDDVRMAEHEAREEFYGDDWLIDGVGFADPGGSSALCAATRNNPRDRPCPTCGRENMLTRIDVSRGYQCNRCADQLERGGY